ncbi:hypothetical protein RISK_006416 [Rhodopirellula islandica]|uniref:Uncharacterized protein n=1 Tax=Rhodopirellula islandica TaxID=595434 RepID=A0A0J1E7X3_RHOIS|nr:hypothetical protein RISK_006416 [Rhodopirellula islandica]
MTLPDLSIEPGQTNLDLKISHGRCNPHDQCFRRYLYT